MTAGRAEISARLSSSLSTVRQRLVPTLFGDRVGLTLFLGVIVALSVCWRVGFYITDTYAVANTVVNVAGGHFAVQRIRYSLTLGSQPGLVRHGSQVFGRNYAEAVLSVPFYWLLEAGSRLVELRLLLAAGWSLLAAGFASQLGTVLDRPRVTLVGTLLALGAFLANAVLATPLDPRWTALLAIQLLTLLAGGVVAVALYRLARTFHGPRVGIAAGSLAALSLPIAFWATIPKRHVLSAALIAIVVLAFARSRRPGGSPTVRASAYAAVGVLAWLHAAEALVVFVVLVPVDLATAPSNDRRTLAVVALVFALSLVPFVVTNLAVSGNPLETPRMLSGLGDAGHVGPNGRITVGTGGSGTPGGPGETTPNGTTTPGGTATPGGTPSPGSTTPTGPAGGGSGGLVGTLVGLFQGIVALGATVLAAVPDRLGQLWGFVDDGLSILVGKPERLNHVFFRSGRVPGLHYGINDQEAIELTVLESAPVLGLLAAVPVVWGRRWLETGWRSIRGIPGAIRTTPRYQTDLLAGGIAVTFTLLYLPRLPLYSQITMRYLVPAMPLALYGVVRLPPVREGIDDHWRQFVWAYASASVVGIVGVVAIFRWIDPALGEAMQFHALLDLLVAGVATLVVVVAVVTDREETVVTAVGAAGGAGTALFALAGLEYFTYGTYALPIAHWLSNLVALF
ncbi:MAG: hypothetical protein ABEI57_01405 [Halapricum sp.]